MDEVSIEGLSALFDEEKPPPYLELRLRSGSHELRAAILAAEEQWCLNVRDENGKTYPGDGELYPTQTDAILAAILTALFVGHLPLGSANSTTA